MESLLGRVFASRSVMGLNMVGAELRLQERLVNHNDLADVEM